jgi:tripartite-type tricarboxylate transporter receptor subunit TctC
MKRSKGQTLLRFKLFAAAAGLLGVFAAPAQAQTYPSQPIRLIVPTPAGGIADLVGRTLATKLGEAGKTVVVENRTGGAGVIAAETVARATPDGYTIYVGFHQTQTILPHLQAKLPYDATKDFAPIILVAASANVLVVHPSVPAKSVQELIAYAKANPGKLTYASQGNGSSGHIVGEQFKQATGTDLVHVPYRGAAPAVQDLVAGHVSLMFDIAPLAKTQIEAKTVRGLAVAGSKRLSVLPDLPSMAESGLPELEGGPWFGLLGPAGTPRPIIDWLNAETRKAFSAPDVRDRLFISQGINLPLGTPEEFAAFIEADSKRWGEVIRRGNIRIEQQ